MQNKLNKQIPYNTGKVRIGCNYQPPRKNYVTQNGEFWQDVLTGVHQKRRQRRMQAMWYVVALVGVFMLMGVWA